MQEKITVLMSADSSKMGTIVIHDPINQARGSGGGGS